MSWIVGVVTEETSFFLRALLFLPASAQTCQDVFFFFIQLSLWPWGTWEMVLLTLDRKEVEIYRLKKVTKCCVLNLEVFFSISFIGSPTNN